MKLASSMEETRRDGEEVSGRKLLHPVPGSCIYADTLHDICLILFLVFSAPHVLLQRI